MLLGLLAACGPAGSGTAPMRSAAPAPPPANAPGSSPFAGAREVVPPASPADVPLTKIGDFYFAEVRVHGRPYRFTLETGGSGFSVSARLARELGLAAAGTAQMMGGGSVPTVHVDSLSIGGVQFRGLVASVTDRWAGQDPSFDGIISIPLFRQLLVTLDLPRSRLRLQRGALPEPDGHTILALALQDRGGRADLPLRIGGVEVPVVVDTRSAIPLLIPGSLAGQLRFSEAPVPAGQATGPSVGTFQLQRARLASDAALGAFTIRQPWLMLRDRPGALVGVPFIEQFVITLDLANGRARVVAANGETSGAIDLPGAVGGGGAAGAQTPPRRYMGFGLVPRRDGGKTVTAVAPGSSAEQAGLREGDELVEFNGVPAASIQPSLLREAALRDDAARLVVLRGGQRIVLMVRPFTRP
jgi:hypothetical protein